MRAEMASNTNSGMMRIQFLIVKSTALDSYFIQHLHHVYIYLFYIP